MLDTHATIKDPIPQIEVSDYIELGRLVLQWVEDPTARPANVEDLRRQLHGIAAVPERIRNVEFVQNRLDTLVVPLPAPEVVEEGMAEATDPMNDGRSPLPQFYGDHFRPGFGPVMTPLDTLVARIGDHTIARCH